MERMCRWAGLPVNPSIGICSAFAVGAAGSRYQLLDSVSRCVPVAAPYVPVAVAGAGVGAGMLRAIGLWLQYGCIAVVAIRLS
jgi:hypothetical protein